MELCFVIHRTINLNNEYINEEKNATQQKMMKHMIDDEMMKYERSVCLFAI